MSLPHISWAEFQQASTHQPYERGEGQEEEGGAQQELFAQRLRASKCLVVLEGYVLDLTSFMAAHPGGIALLQNAHAQDITLPFRRMPHSDAALQMALKGYAVARIGTTPSASTDQTTVTMPTTHEHQQQQQQEQQLKNRGRHTGSGVTTADCGSDCTQRAHVLREKQRQRSADERGEVKDIILDALYYRDVYGGFGRQQDPPAPPALGNAADGGAVIEPEWRRRKRGFGANWHDNRRFAMIANHSSLDEFVRTHRFFWWSLVCGVYSALIHYTYAFCVVPTAAARHLLGVQHLASSASSGSASMNTLQCTEIPFGYLTTFGTTIPFLNGLLLTPLKHLLSLPVYVLVSPVEYLVLMTSPPSGSSSSSPSSAWASWFGFAFLVFALAYTVGALCKMAQFAMLHELIHETVHPVLCDNWTLGTFFASFSKQQQQQQQEEISSSSNSSWLQRRKRDLLNYPLGSTLKLLAMRCASLPSIGCTIFEYYENQHLGHHRFLGSLEFSDTVAGVVNGTQSGDGDQISVNSLLMRQKFLKTTSLYVYDHSLQQQQQPQRGAESGELGRVEGEGEAEENRRLLYKQDNWTPAPVSTTQTNPYSTVATSSSSPPRDKKKDDDDTTSAATAAAAAVPIAPMNTELNSVINNTPQHYIAPILKRSYLYKSLRASTTIETPSRQDWIRAHPTLSKLMYDPLFHLVHYNLMLLTTVIHITSLTTYLGMWFLTTMHELLPRAAFDAVFGRLLCGIPLKRYFERNYRVTVSIESMELGMQAIWCQASVGVQTVVSALVLWYGITRHVVPICAATATTAGAQAAASSHINVAGILGCLTYLMLSEMFNWGFLFHPYFALFASIHRSHGIDGTASNETLASDPAKLRATCQPTASMYNPWFSCVTFNLTHHVEHHDFPSVPWIHLPKVTRLAPEFYKTRGQNLDGRNAAVDLSRAHANDVVPEEEEQEEAKGKEEGEDGAATKAKATATMGGGAKMNLQRLNYRSSVFGVLREYLTDHDSYVYACAPCTD